jgi:hypothetical protein
MKIKIIDNYIPPKQAYDIEEFFLGPKLSWYWNKETIEQEELEKYKTKNTVNTGQFTHSIMRNYENDILHTSDVYNSIKEIFKNINFNLLIRIKSNLNLNVTGYKKKSHQPIHDDARVSGYRSLIYYINDSDGDTIFFNDKLKEIKRVNPKKGRAVIFDSQILHCGCNPIKQQQRGVINFIYKENENSILYR